ncbi:hypothetical protein [Pyruvatibacter sp.]|uniref:cell division protein FtsL n=1 Tax=Pyruvatibacter sp. TaxID=1981328 RepID=UPI0032F05D66
MMRILNTAVVLVTLAVAFALYHVKYETQAEQRDIRNLTAELATEHDAIQVLQAEWSLLNQPERLEGLVERHTDLQPLAPAQIVTLADLPARPKALPGLEADPSLGGYAGTVAPGPGIQ